MSAITTYRQAFDLYLWHHVELRDYLMERTHDPEATTEISQRVIEKIANSCCNGRTVGNEGAWVRGIARNATTDYYEETQRGAGKSEVPEDTTAFSPNPYPGIEVFLRPLMGFFPEKYAAPLRMDLFDQLPQKEIAQRLGLGLSATKSRIQRARRLLRREMVTCFELEIGADGKRISSACLKESCTPLKNFADSLPDDASFDDR